MSYRARYTKGAKEDLVKLYGLLVELDLNAGRNGLEAIENGIKFLQHFPFNCRKAILENPLLREMNIPFGSKGYVVLFEIENKETVTILAVRHQLEEDYH